MEPLFYDKKGNKVFVGDECEFSFKVYEKGGWYSTERLIGRVSIDFTGVVKIGDYKKQECKNIHLLNK